MRTASGGAPLFWAVGIENTVMPAADVDQLAWTGHREQWRDDLARAAETGVRLIRCGLPWPDLEPEPGDFDWRWADEYVDELSRLGLEPIWDLLHFGAPLWLPEGLRDPDYPERVAQYTGAFAARYPHITRLTPFNEPYIWSFFSGGNGTWAPHEMDDAGFVRSLIPVLRGLRGSMGAIRTANPRAEIWLNDGADRFTAATPELEGLARRLTRWRYAAFDLLHGLAGVETEMGRALLVAGFPVDLLRECLHEPTPADVIGLDYYPGSEHLIRPPESPKHPGDWGQRADYRLYPDPQPPGLAATLLEYHARYGLPLYVAETSAETDQAGWMAYVTHACLEARAAGAEVLGATWWPLLDHVDWNSGLTVRAGHICPGGLYHLGLDLTRRPSPTLDTFQALVRGEMPAQAPAFAFPH